MKTSLVILLFTSLAACSTRQRNCSYDTLTVNGTCDKSLIKKSTLPNATDTSETADHPK